ncbi:MAG: hypothetical protein COB37_06400 [Kordiimonadales bacterium]|nr:MAG: hypothetical protein COB37_06400 [Kordiimonadales bacterium]
MNIEAPLKNAAEHRPMIHAFVTDFYSDIRKHTDLGPVFNNKIGAHWDSHIETLTDFWVTVLFSVRAYKGNPFLVHKQIPDLAADHFDVWLGIFETSANRMLPTDLANSAVEKSHRIADSLRQGLFFKP